MPRILYVWNYREWGGAQIYYLSLIRQALPTHEVAVIIPEDSDTRVLQYLDDLGIQVEFVEPAPPAIGSNRSLIGKLRHRTKVFRSENRLAARALRRLNDEKCAGDRAIVHIDLGFWQSYRALSRLCRRANVFVTQHTALADPGGARAAIWRFKGRRMSRRDEFMILASNNDAKRSLRKFLTSEKFDSIPVTYTGIDPDEITSVRVESPSAPKHSATVVTTVGQFVERKGCWTVLEALQKLRDAGEAVQFVWLGTSALDAVTKQRIERYGLGDAFRFLSAEEIGARSKLLAMLATADIFVLASTNEGLPIALVEAMALGLPCIASRVGAIPEAIDHDASGLLVAPGDADELAGAIRMLIHDEETRRMFGTAARAIAFEKFDQKKTAEETIAIYNNLWKTRG